MSKRKLNQKELEAFLDLSDSDTDPYHNSEDEDPDWATSGSETESAPEGDIQSSSSDESVIEPEDNEDTVISDVPNASASPQTVPTTSSASDNIIWNSVPQNYTPRIQLPTARNTEILLNSINSQSTEIDIFLKLFPKSLYMFISQCTNERLTILEKKTKKKS